MRAAGVPDYKALLAEAIGVIEGLAGQQAMGDDWYEAPLERFIDAANTPDPVNYGGRKLSVGPGWRHINPDCIEVDGVSYVFHYSSEEAGHVSRDLIGGQRIKAGKDGIQALVNRIRDAEVDAEIYGGGPDDIDAEAAMEGSAFT